MPVISPSEQIMGGVYPLLDGLSPTIGWQFQPQAKGGPAFVILRRTGLGSLKVTASFPLTEDSWARVAVPGYPESRSSPAGPGQAEGP
jgi:hypothetical protein